MLLGIAIMTAFIPGVIGLASITSWAVMWLVMPILLLKCEIEITIIHILGLVFLSYATLSLLWSPHGMLELMQLFALASVFVWGCTLKDLRSVVIGLSIGLGISSIVAIFQFFELETFVYNATIKPSGLFVNSNVYAEVSGMLLILLLINKLWWFIPVTIPGMLISSRSVIFGLGISLGLMLWTKSKILTILLFISSCFLVYFMTFLNYDIRLNNLSSASQRLYIWYDMLDGFKIFGNGVGSFVYVFPNLNKHLDAFVLVENAHNDLLQLIFEFGIGVIPLILIVGLLLKANNDYRYALVFFIVISFFGFPLHIPATVFMVSLVAAQLAKSSLGSWATFNSRRSILFNRLETA